MSSAILLAGFLVAAWLTRRFCNPESVFHVLDHPNERSLHVQPVPRSGGVAILFALGVSVVGLSVVHDLPGRLVWLIPGVLLLGGISFLDDRLDVRPAYRLVAQVMAASLLVWGNFSLAMLELPGWMWEWPAWVASAFSLVFVVWMTNLYNFMDGMDGFAGGMAVIGFGTFALLGMLAGNTEFMLLNLSVVAAAAGFLVFNFPPARIFMGDVGSSVLGFLAAAFSLWGAQARIFPFWVALLVFSPFIVDATVTLARRLFRGEKVWRAHRDHYYQRLVGLGWGHRRTVLWEYALMLLGAFLSIVVRGLGPEGQWALIGLWVVVYAALMGWIDLLSDKESRFA